MRILIALLSLLAIAACENATAPQGPPVTVYAQGDDDSELGVLLQEFSSASGIPVSVSWGESASNTDKLINDPHDKTDVLITPNVADIWRAADKGVLRPISREAHDGAAALLKDPDGFWAALDVRPHAIASGSSADHSVVTSFSDLATSGFLGQVCLSSSSLHVNRSLIAMLINERGVKNAERIVRGWIRNLAVPPFSSQPDLLLALRDGSCQYGIVGGQQIGDDLTYVVPNPNYRDIDGIGVARHAQHPEVAQDLVQWLLQKRKVLDTSLAELPVSIAGWRDEDALLLVERAGYR